MLSGPCSSRTCARRAAVNSIASSQVAGVLAAVALDQRLGEAVRRLDGVVVEAAADADLVAADGVERGVRLDHDALPFVVPR